MRVINILASLGLVSAHKLKSHWIAGADDMVRREIGCRNAVPVARASVQYRQGVLVSSDSRHRVLAT